MTEPFMIETFLAAADAKRVHDVLHKLATCGARLRRDKGDMTENKIQKRERN